jgi:hypothetical protein
VEVTEMQIKIRDNAKSIYIGTCNAHRQVCNWDWAYLLEVLQGETLEVETDFLFHNQFNTAPIAKDRVDPLMERLDPCRSQQTRDYVHKVLTGTGMRVMAQSVAEVIDDVRPEMMRCNWCGKCAPIADACPHCEKDGHLERFRTG